MSLRESTQTPKKEAFKDQLAFLDFLSAEDPRMVSWEKSGFDEDLKPKRYQFGNNFYLLFLARHKVAPPLDDTLVSIYWDPIQTQAEAWSHFEQNNQPLLAQIDEVLPLYQKYADLEKTLIELMFADNDLYEDFYDSIEHPLKLEAYAIPIWDKLSPLFEQAFREMEISGLEVRDLLG